MTPPAVTTLPRRAAAVAATAAVMALAVVGAATPSSGTAGRAPHRVAFPNRPTRVLVLGDSVIKGTVSQLPGALDGREIVMDAEVSRSTGATASAAAGHGTDWDVVVIQVGHNDGGSPGAYQLAYRQMLDQFAAVPRVAVLTLHESRSYYADVNAFLRGEAASRGNVRVADWNAVNHANSGAAGGDGLHLTGTGASLMTGLVVGAVEQAEADFASPPTTLPPTTLPPTTLPPTTTTTEAAALIPATSIVQDPPTTTSTSTPATTAAESRVVAVRPTEPVGNEPDDGGPAPAATAPVLLVATAALGGALTRWAKHLPR